MNHIDEGTIHAWIDGALDATQSREVESHVAQCAACAEAVAEARGLVAGASRILLALDDVPAGVTPKRAPSPRRQWRAAPWVTGIAAAFVLAIGISTWRRGDVSSEMPSLKLESDTAAMRVEVGQRAATATGQSSTANNVAEIAATPQSPPSPPSPTIPAQARAKSEVRPQTPPSGRGALQRQTLADVAPQPQVGRASARRDAVAEGGVAGGGLGAVAKSAAVSSAPAADAVLRSSVDTTRLRRSMQSARLDEVVVTSATEGGGRAARADSSGVDQLAGCYNVRPESPQQETAIVPRTSDAAKRAAAPAAAPPTRARAEYTKDAAPPMMVRLDTARKRVGYAVLAATADSLIGFWTEIGRDSASVDLLVRGEHVVTAKNRVECPERKQK
jgi:putative zinc finger protein